MDTHGTKPPKNGSIKTWFAATHAGVTAVQMHFIETLQRSVIERTRAPKNRPGLAIIRPQFEKHPVKKSPNYSAASHPNGVPMSDLRKSDSNQAVVFFVVELRRRFWLRTLPRQPQTDVTLMK